MAKRKMLSQSYKGVLMSKPNLSAQDYEYMNALSAAMLEKSPKRFRMVFWFWALAILVLIIWMNLAQVDEIVRGQGEVVPSGENQMIQNLEGGIVEAILVHEGSLVKAGDLLLKIDNQKSESSYESNALSANALEAKILRLKAESTGTPLVVSSALRKSMPEIIAYEESLYKSNQNQLQAKLKSLDEQLYQRKQELVEARSRLELLGKDKKLINEEVLMMAPMVEKGVKSRIDFLKLQREANGVEKEYEATKLSIPRLESAIKEVLEHKKEARSLFKVTAKEKLSEAVSTLQRTQSNADALQDQVQRTLVRSPIDGIVQELFVHTVGGVVKPGEDLIEIVPSHDELLVQVKVKPSDIAFIYPDQRAKVKFSAYDFAIYGGLEGKVVHISADSETDNKENVFFTVHIKTDKNYLGTVSKPLKIIPGMTVDVDIITGKKSVMDYVLKPILKSKQYSFSER